MKIVLSPAKSMDFKTPAMITSHSIPDFLEQSQELVDKLKTYTPAKLSSLMKISDKLAILNVARFGSWSLPFTQENAKQAMLCFTGNVYQGLDATTLDRKGLNYAQKNIRILSGLYGVLKPLDLIQPYRLEMGSKVTIKRNKNLYDYWGMQLNQALTKELEGDKYPVLVNLASKEYFSSLKLAEFPHRQITPIFKDWKNGQYKNISFFAKKARGLMSRFAIDNKIENPEKLKSFDSEGYQFDEKLSSENDWVYTRKQ
ncbi:MAG: peroxide stress protein YaaA [Gammaproteobacteria bacterium]|nr:MAG: peroxide stress protein YaaA [Gammaproteobacteria bacterium]